MATVIDGVIRSLSVSQAETFDHAQVGGCGLRWWFDNVQGLRAEADDAQTDGQVGHELLATYLRTGQGPQGRVRMGKAVRGAIARAILPPPGPYLHVEQRFDGQRQRDADGKWIPVDVENTLKLGGIPWDGFIDVRWRDQKGRVHIMDHKFSADIHAYAKTPEQLIHSVQMPVYCLDSLRVWDDADTFVLHHHYVSRRGVDGFMRSKVVSAQQVWDREGEIRAIVASMRDVAQMKLQTEVPFNRNACSAWRGCPHQSVCKAFKSAGNIMSIEDEGMFNTKPQTDACGLDDLADLFGDAPSPAKSPPNPDAGHGAGDLFGGDDFTPGELATTSNADGEDIPAPEASAPAAQPPPEVCGCGATMTPENSSRLQDGVRAHVKCPLTTPPAETPRRRGRPPKAATPPPETTSAVAPVQPDPQADARSMVERLQATGVAAAQAKFGPGGPEDLTKPHPINTDGARTQRFQGAEPNPPSNGPKSNPDDWFNAMERAATRGLEVRFVFDVSPGLTALAERILAAFKGKA